ncbi:MAG: hypothetical protein BGO98_14800 [Myxococcales bacterium 68-20]|nr:MAG: hypothetical protein BGO98_14800 [Myxococcales bacterium 68-20]
METSTPAVTTIEPFAPKRGDLSPSSDASGSGEAAGDGGGAGDGGAKGTGDAASGGDDSEGGATGSDCGDGSGTGGVAPSSARAGLANESAANMTATPSVERQSLSRFTRNRVPRNSR